MLKFSVAVNTGWGDKKNTTFYNCALWQASDKLQQLMLKGQLIGITGEPSLREYSTDSGKRQSLDVRVNNVILLGSKPTEASDAGDDEKVPF